MKDLHSPKDVTGGSFYKQGLTSIPPLIINNPIQYNSRDAIIYPLLILNGAANDEV